MVRLGNCVNIETWNELNTVLIFNANEISNFTYKPKLSERFSDSFLFRVELYV